jgi:hypothetical protein
MQLAPRFTGTPMTMRIKRLKCHVTVRRGGQPALLHQPAAAGRPSLTFAQPTPLPKAETTPSDAPPPPADEHTERVPALSPAQADARQVCEQVYNLMRNELSEARRRTRPW